MIVALTETARIMKEIDEIDVFWWLYRPNAEDWAEMWTATIDSPNLRLTILLFSRIREWLVEWKI